MQGETLFISDLHLDGAHPEIQQQFLDFLNQDAQGSDALYILGDLFEVWLGDDDDNPDNLKTISALKTLSKQGTPIFIQHGNRDFLLADKFEQMSGCTLLPDPHIIDVYQQSVLIMHGDLLCTDDVEYQKFRLQVRDPNWQAQVLKMSLIERRQLADSFRQQSHQQTQQKAEDIMDVSQQTVDQYMNEHNATILVHGHTHRPAIHDHDDKKRIVLGDWYSQGSVLRWTLDDFNLQQLVRKSQ